VTYLNTLCPGWDRTGLCSGNLLLSGRENAGGDACFSGVAGDLLANGAPIFIGHDHISDKERIALCRDAIAQGYRVCWIGFRGFACPSFDFLSAAEGAAGKAALLYRLLSRRGDDTRFSEIADRYFKTVFAVLSCTYEKFRLQDALRVRPEEVREAVLSDDSLSDSEKEETILFLDTKEVLTCWSTLNTRASHLDSLVDTLSGDMTAEKLFSGKTLFFVGKNSSDTDPSDKFFGIMSGMLQMTAYLCDRYNSLGFGYHLLLNCGSLLQTWQLMQLLEIGTDAQHVGVPVCLYQQSISSLLRSHTESVFDLFDTAAVFRTSEGQFWSDFFGTVLTADVTQSYSRKKAALQIYTGGVVGQPYGKHEGAAIHKVEKNLYEARVFASLQDNTCLWYDLRTGRKGKKVLGGGRI